MKETVFDMRERRFHRLVAIEAIGNGIWRCLCDCGQETKVDGTRLRSGGAYSCGCYRREKLKRPRKAAGHTGGGERSITYTAWRAMHRRCSEPNFISYKNYGGRGISVCDRWADFTNFLADMGERPSRKHTIERRNGNGSYEPDNCHWATYAEQANNKRNNRFIDWRGRRQTITQWAKELGVHAATIKSRLDNGMSTDEAFSSGSYRLVEINGERKKLTEVLAGIGISVPTYYQRLRKGWSIERILSTPPKKQGRKRKPTEPPAFPSPAAVSHS